MFPKASKAVLVIRNVTYRSRSIDVLGEQDTLAFNNEEVDKFVNIANEHVKGLLGDGVVFPWAKLGREAVVHESLSSDLSSNRDAESHPGDLESIAQQVEIPECENGRNNGGIGNRRGTLFPGVGQFSITRFLQIVKNK